MRFFEGVSLWEGQTKKKKEMMNRRVPKLDLVKKVEKHKRTEPVLHGATNVGKGRNRSQPRKDAKIALQQDVDKLQKKLRNEENIRRALERAFTRPLGTLPRLPPYLPSHMLELLAEVAVLEEEVVRLEEQLVNFRQGLYLEAIYISWSSKRVVDNALDFGSEGCHSHSNSYPKLDKCDGLVSNSSSTKWYSDADGRKHYPTRLINGRRPHRRPVPEETQGKENKSYLNSSRNAKKLQHKEAQTSSSMNSDKQSHPKASQHAVDRSSVQESSHSALNPLLQCSSNPNKLSEDLLDCLMSIFSQMSFPNAGVELATSPVKTDTKDPYGICSEFEKRDIGPYIHLCEINASANFKNLNSTSSVLHRTLKALLLKLSVVELSGLSHKQKLAFWINIYNSCMMNAFLEQGIPSHPDIIAALMQKATVNVGGHLLCAMTIEHFILRLPNHSRYANRSGVKNDEVTTCGLFGLDSPEPLVTFALSCGSWSSPAVRIYTASHVEEELDAAKRDYLQAAVCISTSSKLAIPKLLDWYLLDFADDLESLMEWICLQLPTDLRNEAIKCFEMYRRKPQPIQVLLYDFSFRYLLAP